LLSRIFQKCAIVDTVFGGEGFGLLSLKMDLSSGGTRGSKVSGSSSKGWSGVVNGSICFLAALDDGRGPKCSIEIKRISIFEYIFGLMFVVGERARGVFLVVHSEPAATAELSKFPRFLEKTFPIPKRRDL
jgi:hypothetical protein